jgi:hypothetical protein
VKIPLLLAVMFLIGLIPSMLVYRAKIWRLNNRIAVARQNLPPISPEEPEPSE